MTGSCTGTVDVIAPCTPNWQCRYPLNGYEYDINNCGQADRLNPVCDVIPPVSISGLSLMGDFANVTLSTGAGTTNASGKVDFMVDVPPNLNFTNQEQAFWLVLPSCS